MTKIELVKALLDMAERPYISDTCVNHLAASNGKKRLEVGYRLAIEDDNPRLVARCVLDYLGW